MSKQPAMPNTYATYLSDQGKPLLGRIGHVVFGNSGGSGWRVRDQQLDQQGLAGSVATGLAAGEADVRVPTVRVRSTGTVGACPWAGGREPRAGGQQRAGVPDRQPRCLPVRERDP